MKLNRTIYTTILISAIVFIFLWEDPWTYAALYAALAVPIVSLAVSAACARRFDISEGLSRKYVIKGESAEYFFNVKNRSFMPFSRVTAVFHADAAINHFEETTRSFFIEPQRTKGVRFAITCPFRGEYRLGVKKITVYDTLGLFKFRRFINDAGLSIYVNPQLIKRSVPLVAREDEAPRNINQLSGDDVTNVSDLREYVAGDSMRRVHWKATAKRNELIVKNFQAVSKSYVVLLIDNSAADGLNPMMDLAIQDRMIEELVGTAKFAYDERFPVVISHFSKPLDLGAVVFDKIYAEAAELRFDARDADICKRLDDIALAALDFMNIVVFVQSPSRVVQSEIKEKARELGVFGHNVILEWYGS
jgi:uncharacterized protein (DUF58 family)